LYSRKFGKDNKEAVNEKIPGEFSANKTLALPSQGKARE
jgi:hypothetical protein